MKIPRNITFTSQVQVLLLIIIVLFSGINGYKNNTKIPNFNSGNSSNEYYFNYTLPNADILANFKNESFTAFSSFIDYFKISYTGGIDILASLINSFTTKFYDCVIKIRYYYPVYIYCRVFRI
jgi:hypothetical protein